VKVATFNINNINKRLDNRSFHSTTPTKHGKRQEQHRIHRFFSSLPGNPG
jgi:hypothetical protein